MYAPRALILYGLLCFAMRIAGIWLASRLGASPGLQRWLEGLPPAVMSAMVASQALQSGWTAALAASAAILLAMITSRQLLSAAGGAAIAAAAALLAGS